MPLESDADMLDVQYDVSFDLDNLDYKMSSQWLLSFCYKLKSHPTFRYPASAGLAITVLLVGALDARRRLEL
jgi:hypothetical protein